MHDKNIYSRQEVLPNFRFIALLILLGLVYWMIDGLIDTFLFGSRLTHSLFQPTPHEFWMRSITLLILILLVVITRMLINKRKKAEQTARHLNRVLRAIRNVNQLITKENDESRLIQKSCKFLTENRGYKGALIILIDEQGKFVKLEESGWKNRRKELEDQLREGYFIECFRKALNQKGVILIKETLKECSGCPLIAGDINNRSLTCRIEYDGKIYGLISVNLPKHFAALKEEQELVEEVAGDLAFAIHKIRMEGKLRQTEQQYRLLAETATDIICIHDMEGKIRYLNPAGLNILGKTQEEIRGENIHNHIYRKEELNNRKKERLKGDSDTYTYQTYISNFKGENIPLEINSTPIQQKGEMEGILIIARDITEREQARERIQRYLNDLQIVYEVTSNLLKTENEDEILEIIGNRIHILNPSAYILLSSLDEKETDTLRIKKLFGFQGLVNDIIKTVGTDPREVPIKLSELTEENNHRLKAGRLEHIKGGIFELLNQKLSEDKCRKIEEYLRIHQIYSMGFLHKGKPCGGVTIMLKEGVELNKQSLIENLINQASVALTQKQSEKALEIAKNKAIESDRLKSTFLMNLSHEIRTPLNGIMGFSQILQEREFPFEKQKEFLNIVHNKADQLLNVLNNLLDLSKIEAEQLNIKQEDCYLNDIMYEIYDTYILELEKNKKTAISLSYHCGLKREESRLYSDCSRFRQILNNLVSNAIKFTEEGAIDFGYEFEKSDTLVFYVKDTGIGIPANKKGEIFEPFRQGDESTNREYEGTGLGLSLSKSLVKLLGGSMWVESEEGQGSSFYFTIPYSLHKYKPREAKPDVSEYSYTWPGHKVLIVEDDPVSLEFMQEIFSETRVQIFSAQNGKEALHFFRQNPDINLILMDIRLPDMSGLEVVKNIRLENNHTPIIAQTAYTMDNDAKKCLEAGCTDYLTKPIDIQAMLNVMNKHLKQSI